MASRRQASPVRIFDVYASNTIAYVALELDQILTDTLCQHHEVGIISVTGKRNQDKCILINYIIHYMDSISDSKTNAVMLTENDQFGSGVLM